MGSAEDRRFPAWCEPFLKGKAYELKLVLGRSPIRADGGVTDISPDGMRGFAGARDGTLTLWDLSSRETLLEWKGHSHGVAAVAFSRDGRELISVDIQGGLKVWEAETGREVRSYEWGGDLARIVFSSDRALALVIGHQGMTLRDLGSGRVVSRMGSSAGGVGQGQDLSAGKMVLCDGRFVRILDAGSGAVERTFELRQGEEVRAISPDGKRMTTFRRTRESSQLALWDLERGGDPVAFKAKGNVEVTCAAFSPDGKHVLSGGHQNHFALWDAETLEPLWISSSDRTGSPQFVDLSPARDKAICGGSDVLMLLDVGEKRPPRVLAGYGGLGSAVASPDGSLVAVCLFNAVQLREMRTGKVVRSLRGSGPLSTIAFSSGGDLLFGGTAEGGVAVWSVEEGRLLRVMTEGSGKGVTRLLPAADGETCLSFSWPDVLRMWDVQKGVKRWEFQPPFGKGGILAAWLQGSEVRIRLETGGTYALSASDGKELPAPFPAGEVRGGGAWAGNGRWRLRPAKLGVEVVDVESGEIAGRIDLGFWPPAQVAFSEDGKRLAAASADRRIRVWDLESGKQIRSIGPHDTDLGGISFAEKGRLLLSWDFRSLRLNDAAREIEVWRTERRNVPISCAKFLPDGLRILSAGRGTVAMWDLDGGAPLWQVEWEPDGSDVIVLSPDGRYAAVGGAQAIGVFETDTGKRIHELKATFGRKPTLFFRSDSKALFFKEADSTKLLDLASGASVTIREDARESVSSAAFSGDCSQVFSCRDSKMEVWDAATGRSMLEHDPGIGKLSGIACSGNGRRLAFCSKEGVVVADTATLKEVSRLVKRRYLGAVGAVTLNQDGSLLLARGEEGVALIDVLKGEILRVFEGSREESSRFGFSGNRIFMSGGAFRVWDLKSGEEIKPSADGHRGVATCMGVSRDGRLLVSAGSDRTLRCWDLRDGSLLRTVDLKDKSADWVEYAPDGRSVAVSVFDRLQLWDPRLAKQKEDLPIFGRIGKFIYSSTKDQIVTAQATLDLATKKVKQLDQSGGIDPFLMIPLGNPYVSGGGFYYAMPGGGVQDLRSGGKILWRSKPAGPHDPLPPVWIVCSRTGHLAIHEKSREASAPFEFSGWRSKLMFSIPLEQCSSIDLSPDGSYFVSSKPFDSLKIWDAKTSKELDRIPGIASEVIEFLPDSSGFFVPTQNGPILLFNVKR